MFLIFDTETGGIGYKTHSLLSASFIVADENLIHKDSIHLLLVPDDRIIKVNPKALVVNKIDLITHNEVAITYSQGRTEIETFLKKWGVGEKLEPVGWGVGFDILTLKEHLIHEKLWNRFISYRSLDLCSVSRMLKLCNRIGVAGGLQETADHLLGPSNDPAAHTAAGDTYRTLEVFRYFKMLMGANPFA